VPPARLDREVPRLAARDERHDLQQRRAGEHRQRHPRERIGELARLPASTAASSAATATDPTMVSGMRRRRENIQQPPAECPHVVPR
jgi:hypothetical protein